MRPVRTPQPHGAMRVALVLYGKVGTWTTPSSGTSLTERAYQLDGQDCGSKAWRV